MKRIQTFVAEDARGLRRSLHVYEARLAVPSTRGSHGATIGGMKEIVTDDDEAVNRLEKGRYQIVATNEILTCSDEDAP